jgi:Tfp pilus assembly protein PilO
MRRWRVPAAGVAVALLLAAIYVVSFDSPRRNRIAALRAESKQLQAQQVTLKKNIEALEKVAAHEPEFNAARQLLDNLIPPGLAQASLLAQMQAAAQAAGVQLVSVTFSDPKIPEGAPASTVPGTVLAAMPLTVVVNGPFPGITNMLRRIESESQRAVLIQQVALAEADAGFPTLTGTWSGQAYALLPTGNPLLADANPSGKQSPTTTPDGVKP